MSHIWGRGSTIDCILQQCCAYGSISSKKCERKRQKLTHALDRTVAATGILEATVTRMKTEDDVDNWSTENRGHVQVNQES